MDRLNQAELTHVGDHSCEFDSFVSGLTRHDFKGLVNDLRQTEVLRGHLEVVGGDLC